MKRKIMTELSDLFLEVILLIEQCVKTLCKGEQTLLEAKLFAGNLLNTVRSLKPRVAFEKWEGI